MTRKLRSAAALLLTALMLSLSLTACGSSSELNRTDYDQSKYALATGLSDVSFIVPKEFYNERVDYSTFDSYTAEEQTQHPFEWTGQRTYSIFQPGTYAVYAFYIGAKDHIEGKEDVDTLAQFMGISDYVTFTARGDSAFETKSDTDTGTIVNTFSVVIHDHSIPGTYNGYLTIYRRGDNRVIYALADGFTEINDTNDAIAKTVAKSIVPNDQYK